jgi:uncharacterized protein (PEP-CTERM system associated)
LGHNTHKMPAGGLRLSLRSFGLVSTALAASLLAAPFAYAQEPAAVQAGPSPAPASQFSDTGPRASGQSGVSSFVGSLIPGFQFDAAVNLSESYVTNATGTAAGARSDYLTLFGLNAGMHDHSRRVNFDATYSGSAYFYANDTQPTQFANNLDALASVIAIPDYLTFFGRAFIQPVVITSLGVNTANGSVAAGGFRNGYGYSVGPDVTFRLGDFATSDTNATFGQAYFTELAGAGAFPGIPGVRGPQNISTRNVREMLNSGADFSRLTWSIVATLSETDRPQGLMSEKAGIGTFRYAVSREISLLATGGYDAISNTGPLTQDVSGPVAMGGIGITFGDELNLEVQAGQKYNSFSFQGSLRYNITPTAALTGSATDGVATPEGQLLNNLNSLTATPGGALTSLSNVYANGTAASQGGFDAQSPGSLSFNQGIARYQQVNLTFSEDFERDHAQVSVFGNRRTELSGVVLGSAVNNSWGTNVSLSHDITRQLVGTIGGGYTNFQELGGHARMFNVDGELSYSLSPDTRVYFRGDFIDRESSQSLQALSPFTGSLQDVRITLGLSHTL